MKHKAILAAFAGLLILSSCTTDNSRYVDVFMGTAGDHGQVSPAAQVPFGLASVCPDVVEPSHVGYDHDQAAISGFSATRLSGIGGRGAGGNLRMRPAAAEELLEIVKGTEKAHPGYYETMLSNGVKARLTAAAHLAVEEFTFPKGSDALLHIDFNSSIDPRIRECAYTVTDGSTIEGWVKSATVGARGAYTIHFRIASSMPFEVAQSDSTTALLAFPKDAGKVEMRLALSPLDSADAGEIMAGAASRSFEAIHKSARAAWKGVLSKVDVEGSTEEQRKLFYTSMYRVYLTPIDATSEDGRYLGTDGQVHEADGWKYYSSWSMWDTFRTKFPMFCLLSPDEMGDFCRSLVSLYCTGKRNWATLDECVPTVRTEHSQIAMLDAWSKGVRGFDMAPAFPAMEKEVADGLVPGSHQGLTRNAPDQLMETIYDLWAMGRIASAIGNQPAAERYSRESEELFEAIWKRDFMTITDEFALMRGNGMYQGTRWQYRWALPIYADRMREWAGEEQLASQLEEFFSRHLFNQGNEPDIQTPFMFNLFGRPELTDSLVHALLVDEGMTHLYGGNAEYPEPFVGRAFRLAPDGYAPEMDEDDGTMSAWYMFCQMGFYPVCVGTDAYELFTPLFSKVTLHLKDHDVKLVRRCAEGAPCSVVVDGKKIAGRNLSHSQLISARVISFEDASI